VRFLIDTCVVSEWKRRQPAPAVLAWRETLEQADLRFSIVTVGELAKGILRLPAGRRRDDHEAWLQELRDVYRDQILSVAYPEVRAWAEISAAAEAAGAMVGAIDGLLPGTARAHGLVLATRNTQNFLPTGVPLYDPWTDSWQNR
jgi:predicted nucleic acid-binding protein